MDFDPLSSGGSIIFMSLNPVKKEVRVEVEMSEKVWVYVPWKGNSKIGARAPGARRKVLKQYVQKFG